jgi:hypothetical protein
MVAAAEAAVAVEYVVPAVAMEGMQPAVVWVVAAVVPEGVVAAVVVAALVISELSRLPRICRTVKCASWPTINPTDT